MDKMGGEADNYSRKGVRAQGDNALKFIRAQHTKQDERLKTPYLAPIK